MNPFGIFGAIKISRTAFNSFCAHHGRALVEDAKYIAANGHAYGAHMGQLQELAVRNATQKQMQEFFAKYPEPNYVRTPEGYLHDAGDQLMVQYEEQTQTLFYLFVLNQGGDPAEMAEVPSFKVLQRITAFKDTASVDVVVFSSDMPNFMSSSIMRVYSVTQQAFKQVDEPLMQPMRKELNRLTEKFYYGAKVYPDDGYAEPLRTIVKGDIEALLKAM
jgi:hypothetical protein